MNNVSNLPVQLVGDKNMNLLGGGGEIMVSFNGRVPQNKKSVSIH